jgi:hypothetical protein
MDLETVHERSRRIITQIQNSEELLQALERGIPLPSAQQTDFKVIATPEKVDIGLIKRARIDLVRDEVSTRFIEKAGIILSVFNPNDTNELEDSADADQANNSSQIKINVTEPVKNAAAALTVAMPATADLKVSDILTPLVGESSTPNTVVIGIQSTE